MKTFAMPMISVLIFIGAVGPIKLINDVRDLSGGWNER
jgi:hypothetical protein